MEQVLCRITLLQQLAAKLTLRNSSFFTKAAAGAGALFPQEEAVREPWSALITAPFHGTISLCLRTPAIWVQGLRRGLELGIAVDQTPFVGRQGERRMSYVAIITEHLLPDQSSHCFI